MGKRDIRRLESLSDDSNELIAHLKREKSDLSVVLVGCSFIDACLGALLERFLREGETALRPLDVRGGALGSFVARSDMAYCLGLITKRIYQNLIVIAEIRNQFAHHHLALTFELPEVAAACDKLDWAGVLDLSRPRGITTPRKQFVLCAAVLAGRLTSLAKETKRVA